MNNPAELTTLENFTDILDRLGIAYAVGGSIASSAYGTVRFTEDVDIVVEPLDDKEKEFFELVKHQYYISKEAMRQALKERSSFNVIHFESAFKIDVFIRKDIAFEKQLMSRAKGLKLSDSLEKSFSVVSPEDIILLKLQWYSFGGQGSERQWNDILGIFTVQAKRLDLGYLKKWAAVLGINHLLEKVISETA